MFQNYNFFSVISFVVGAHFFLLLIYIMREFSLREFLYEDVNKIEWNGESLPAILILIIQPLDAMVV